MRISDWSSDVCSSDLGTTFAAPRIAKAYREHVERLTDPSGIIPPARRRGRGRQFLSITELAACAGTSREQVKRELQRFGIAYLDRLPSYVQHRLMPTVPGMRFASKVDGEIGRAHD